MDPYLRETFVRHPRLESCGPDILSAFRLLRDCYARDRMVYVCGNGGSAADAEHIVGELMKSFMIPRTLSEDLRERLRDPFLAAHLQPALRAVALTGSGSLATAIANDIAPELVFAQQVFGYGRAGDVLCGISTSGNSRNVLLALKAARARRMGTLGLSGRSGGEMVALCDVCIRAPASETHRIQELHLPVYHALCQMIESYFFAQGP